MQRCEDNVAARLNGNALQPLSDVSVTVTDDHTGLPAALYSDNGVTQVFQPLKTDDNGYYGFYAANGEYTLTFSGIRIATFTRKVVLNDPDDNPAITKAELAAGSGASLVTFMPAGTGAVSRPLQDKLRDIVSVKDFGAKGDGVTDDSDAINAAIVYARTLKAYRANGITDPGSPYFSQTSALLFPPGAYRVTKSLWFGIDSAQAGWDASKIVECVVGYGAVIVGQTSGKPVLDLSGAFGMRINGLSVFGDKVNSPDIGILVARSGNVAGDNPSAGAHILTNVKIGGDFTLAASYNYGSEINYWVACHMYQNSGRYTYYATNNNARHAVTSSYCTLATSVQSAYGDYFIGGWYKSSTGNATANGAVMCFESLDFGPKLTSGVYIDSSGSVTMPNIWLRNAQGLTSAQTTSFTQSVSVTDCVFEYRANQDIILVDADHTVIDLVVEGCSMPANIAGGQFHIRVGAGGKIKNLRAQHTDGGTLGDPVVTGGSGEIYGEQRAVVGMRALVVGNGWSYIETDLTKDGAFHTIDLAGLGVPVTAKFIAVKVAAKTTAAADFNAFTLRGFGSANTPQNFNVTPQVSGITIEQEGLVPVIGGKIEYSAPSNFTTARILFREYHL